MFPSCGIENTVTSNVFSKPVTVENSGSLEDCKPSLRPKQSLLIRSNYSMEPDTSLDTRTSSSFDKFNSLTLSPITALKLLCAGIEILVKLSGDNALKHPMDNPTKVPAIQTHKKVIERENSPVEPIKTNFLAIQCMDSDSIEKPNNFDEPTPKKTLSGRSELPPKFEVVTEYNIETSTTQCNAIIRKFYSKYLPPISLVDYLMRIHKFCPMPTAVYLATSCYIHRLATDEKTISVTRRNCHRLVLAGLRVTMKVLEDQSYAHSRFSKVGGVTTSELARLEINFCFLINFDFITNGETLLKHVKDLRKILSLHGSLNHDSKMLMNSYEAPEISIKEVKADM